MPTSVSMNIHFVSGNGVVSMGCGTEWNVISAMVTQYRFKYFMGVWRTVLMYVSAVMYPVSYFVEKLPKYAWVVTIQSVVICVESVRYALKHGSFNV
jgi:lipopolysaccharide transport system permease protein